ncbi:chemotaxis protein CheB [Sphingobacterium sp. LRF_L2]|uniref:chemotaxis protein CheB n=1 Tax=Sphingobacterium sp. LRF_L2 TaxID=3369421 RepID=UPI003F621DBC
MKVLLIGGSAGSLKVVLQVLPDLSSAIEFPIILILHRKPDRDSILDVLLNNYTSLTVVEAEDKMVIQAKHVYIAPPDYHLLFESRDLISLDYSEKLNYSRPSIDVSFQSAANVFGRNTVALLLSGANSDGVEGFNYIKSLYGITAVQAPDTAEVEYMPRQAILSAKVDYILRPEEIAGWINNLNEKD